MGPHGRASLLIKIEKLYIPQRWQFSASLFYFLCCFFRFFFGEKAIF